MLYKDWAPTAFDPKGLGLPDRQDWIVAPVIRTRDSGTFELSNFNAAEKTFKNFEIHRFGHWGPGWVEIILVHPDEAKAVEEMQSSLENYPLLDEDDFCQRESEEALEIWQNCYNDKERLRYIRKHKDQFEFRCLKDLIACARGEHFCGYDSDLIGG